MRRTIAPRWLAVVGTGGLDWLRDLSTTSWVLAFDAEASGTTGAVIALSLGTVVPPAGSGPGGVTSALPLRVYAQPLASGSDLLVQATALALGNVTQMTLPTLYPGSYGDALRLSGISSRSSIVPTSIVGAGANFSGSRASVMTTGSATTGGSLYLVGTSSAQRETLAAGDTRLAVTSLSPIASVNGGATATEGNRSGRSRPYQVRSWIDLPASE